MTGETGKQGPAGTPGATGRAGAEGARGAEGAEGGRGITGAAGAAGAEGAKGERGPSPNEGRGFWRQVGVIPRWQLLFVYIVIVGAGAIGFVQVNDALDQIQESRISACDDQAERNRATVAQLDLEIEKIKDPVQKARAKRNREGTIALIDALAPPRTHAQCVKLVTQPQRKPKLKPPLKR